jgi:Ca2+-binding RTX toxin-like protein
MRRTVVVVAAVLLLGAILGIPAKAATPTCFGKTATVVGEPPTPGDIWTDFRGTPGPDVLIGTDSFDRLYGFEGNDLICGRGGYDLFFDGSGDDKMQGGAGGDDLEVGGPGRDTFWGGPGGEYVILGSGDTFYGGTGRDYVESDSSLTAERAYGEGGDDWLVLAEGGPGDVVNGGIGNDTCSVNRADIVTSCEQLTTS